MSSSSTIQVYLGPFVHSVSKSDPYVIVPDGAIGVQDGKIVFVDREENLAVLKERYTDKNLVVDKLPTGQFLIPGFVDTHIHAPQYVNAGLGLDLPLLKWLEKYTFPAEAKFQDLEFARNCYEKVVERTIRSGTTTASYHATIHREASELLAEIVHQKGQRAFIGKVSMDRQSPDFYCETTEGGLAEAEAFVQNILNENYPLVRPSVTPRFAVSCSPTMLLGLAAIAKKYGVNIQSHMNENKDEIKFALELFPECEHYTDIYDKHELLGRKTIMAHCVHMLPAEEDLMASTKTAIAHCPVSNTFLNSGFSPINKFLEKDIPVGLGTDVSGGYSPSLLEAIRFSIATGKTIQMQDESYPSVTYKNAFFLATLGGAEALDVANETGNFQVGKSFDALLIDLASSTSPVHLFPDETMDERIQKFFMLGDDRNIAKVFVAGRNIK